MSWIRCCVDAEECFSADSQAPPSRAKCTCADYRHGARPSDPAQALRCWRTLNQAMLALARAPATIIIAHRDSNHTCNEDFGEITLRCRVAVAVMSRTRLGPLLGRIVRSRCAEGNLQTQECNGQGAALAQVNPSDGDGTERLACLQEESKRACKGTYARDALPMWGSRNGEHARGGVPM
jgi:hypothetical protein